MHTITAADVIEDGYTLQGRYSAPGREPVSFQYRHASPSAVYDYILKSARAATGDDQQAAILALLFPKGQEPRLTAWTVTGRDGKVLPVTPESVRRLPTRIQSAFVDHVCDYTPAQQEADAGNSSAG